MLREREYQIETNGGGRITVVAKDKETALMKILKDKIIEVGHMITFAEAAKDKDFPHPNTYAAYTEYGSFNRAVNHVWQNLQSTL